MIERPLHLKALQRLLTRHRVVGLVGARQVGKTTLARAIVSRRTGQTIFLDLENPMHRARLDDPMLALRDLRGLVVRSFGFEEGSHFPTRHIPIRGALNGALAL